MKINLRPHEAPGTNLEKHAPAGINLQMEQGIFKAGMIFSFLFSLIFFLRYNSAYSVIRDWRKSNRVLQPGSIIFEDFNVILGSSLIGFLLLALCMLALIVYHYIYHWQGSKSIYLMKRLPNRWELHRRCLTLPVLAALLCLLAAGALLLIYYGFYMVLTPEEVLTPGQWQKIWSVLL